MVDIFVGYAGFNAIMDSLKRSKDISDANIRNSVAVELQEKILAAYQHQVALTQRISDLEKEVTSFETWNAEKNRYQLTDYGGGTYAYAMKPEKAEGESPHRICANCYAEGHKSMPPLQYGSHCLGA